MKKLLVLLSFAILIAVTSNIYTDVGSQPSIDQQVQIYSPECSIIALNVVTTADVDLITTTAIQMDPLGKSDAVVMTVDTGEKTEVQNVSTSAANYVMMNLVVASLPPTISIASVNTQEKIGDLQTGEVLLCYTESANNNTTSDAIVSSGQNIEEVLV